MNHRYISALAVLFLTSAAQSFGQQMIHSHNDYRQNVPFYEAYSQGVDCIECDMFYIKGQTFLVGHDLSDLDESMTFDRIYLEPVVNMFRSNGGHAWMKNPDKKLNLMVEIKSKNPVAYLDALKKKLSRYKDVFDPSVNPRACGLFITGFNLPYDSFEAYPAYFMFDVQYSENDGSNLSAGQMAHVASFSLNFRNVSKWDGKSELSAEDRAAILKIIDDVHSKGKLMRFWNTPDTPLTWQTFSELGVDFVNTDHVEACAAFFSNRQN